MECVSEGWIKFDTEKDENKFVHLVRDIAPSAQLKQNGKWIYNSPITMKCDRCGFVIKDWDWHRFKFCPNCGADMRGGDSNEQT
jgi:predicted Zn-ribbon and HTH transcriptional regulator